jgi:hypothetical protein
MNRTKEIQKNKDDVETGRPSEFKEEYVEQAREYVDSCVDTYDPETKRTKVNLPTYAGLANHLKCSKQTLYNWGEKSKDFLDSLNYLLQEQENRLINSGLSGDYQSPIAKLIMSSNHDYSEKSERKHTGGISLKSILREADEKGAERTD